MENSELLQKKLDHIKSVISTIQLSSLDDSLVKDNKMYFDFEDKYYRCSMPSQRDVSNAHKKKDQFYLKAIQEDICLTKEQIKKLLKEKQNVDINQLELEKQELQIRLQDVYIDLAGIHPDAIETIEEQKEKIRDIESQFTDIFVKITDYMSPSIENQLEKVYIEYLTFACCEVCSKDKDNNDKWIPVWTSFEEFEKENSKITLECIKYMSYLLIKTNR